MLKLKIKTLINQFKRVSYSGLLLSKYFTYHPPKSYNTFFQSNRRLTFSTWTRHNNGESRPSLVARIMGFTSAVVGVFGAGSNCGGGLNFNFSPHYSPQECQETNLKAMVVAMMMQNFLDEDELSILLLSIQSVYQSCDVRREWCGSEMKNFMTCSENYGSFQDDRCKNYRKMLKSCLQSKKCAADLNPPKICSQRPEWPYHSPEKYKPPNLRKLPRANCPQSSANNPDVVDPKAECLILTNDEQKVILCEEKVIGLEPCCGGDCGDTIDISGSKNTSTCRSCDTCCKGCQTRGKDDLSTCDDPDDNRWLESPCSKEEETKKAKEEEDARRCAYEQSKGRKDWGDNANVFDYEDWCQQQCRN